MANSRSDIPQIVDPELIVDNVKQPVKVSANFLSGVEDEINTIWAEQADYLTKDNLGDGLCNKPMNVRDKDGNIIADEITYQLNIKQATVDEIGGIKLPEDGSLQLNNSGNLQIDFDTIVKAARARRYDESGNIQVEGKRGAIIPDMTGNVFSTYDDASGLLSAHYELPPASTNLGGVKIDGTIRPDIDVKYANRNLEMESSGHLHVFTNILDRYPTLSDQDPAIKHTLDYVLERVLDMIVQNRKDINDLSVRLSKYFDRVISVAGALKFGKATFRKNGATESNGYIGTHCHVEFDKPMANTDYHVIVTQLTASGRTGEVSVTNYSKLGFDVYNTGKSNIDTFVWMVIPSEVTYASSINVPDENDPVNVVNALPLKRGTAYFNGMEGTVVNLDGAVTYSPDGRKTVSSWIPDETHGDNGEPFASNRYIVLVTPSSAIQGNGTLDERGKIGEFWVENKTSTTFTVKCSGTKLATNERILFDWVAIPYGNVDPNTSSNPFLENASLHHDELLFPIRCGSTQSTAEGEVIIDFGQRVYYNTDFLVFSQLTANTGGHFGEYAPIEYSRTRSGFDIGHTGNATNFTIDWVAIDVRNKDDEYVDSNNEGME